MPPVSDRCLPRLLAVLAIVILPHVRNLPLWIPAFAVGMMLWRLGVARRGSRVPGNPGDDGGPSAERDAPPSTSTPAPAPSRYRT